MLAIDIETTGLDFWHGCSPFAISACDSEGNIHYWEWDVDPLTRKVNINSQDLRSCINLLEADEIVGHNIGFDMRGIELLWSNPDFSSDYTYSWDWEYVHDTLIASHAIRNLWPHGLKDLREVVLFQSNESVDLLRKSVDKARGITRKKQFRKKYGEWRIAKESDPHWPGFTTAPRGSDGSSGWWVFDMWLPRAIVRLAPEFLPPEHEYHYPDADYLLHPWENILKDYNITDTVTTLVLWETFKEELEEEGLWEQYLERKRVLQAAYTMSMNGITLRDNIHTEVRRYRQNSQHYRSAAEQIAKDHGIPEPNLGSPIQLRKLLYDTWGLPVHALTDGGSPATTAEVLEKLRDSDLEGPPKRFIENLLLCRRTEKAMEYLESYHLWSTPHGTFDNLYAAGTTGKPGSGQRDCPAGKPTKNAPKPGQDRRGVSRGNILYLHPSVNITGTKFTRQSSSNPNLQNVGTGRDDGGVIDYNLRVVFGPAPGRLWLDVDYSNIELRIWGYECGNKEFIEAFEQDQSVHLIIAREIHPHLQLLSDEEAKKTKAYKYTKNGDFAIIYGASPTLADQTYKVKGAYDKLSRRFPEVRAFTERLHNQVRSRGYIETMTGYRLYIPRNEPHKAVSGRVQGTAGSIIGRAMIDVSQYLEDIQQSGLDPKLILQVHDELLFDIPASFPREFIEGILQVMEAQGNAIGIPLPVEAKIIDTDWSGGEIFQRN